MRMFVDTVDTMSADGDGGKQVTSAKKSEPCCDRSGHDTALRISDAPGLWRSLRHTKPLFCQQASSHTGANLRRPRNNFHSQRSSIVFSSSLNISNNKSFHLLFHPLHPPLLSTHTSFLPHLTVHTSAYFKKHHIQRQNRLLYLNNFPLSYVHFRLSVFICFGFL